MSQVHSTDPTQTSSSSLPRTLPPQGSRGLHAQGSFMAGPEAADEIQLCVSLPPQTLLCQAGAVLGFGASSSGSKLSFTWRATIGWPFRELLSQRMPLTTQLAFRLQGEITFYINWELFYHGSLIHLHIALSDKRKKCKGGPRGRPHWRQLTPIYQTMSEGGQAWTMLKFGPKAGQTRPVIWVFSAARSRLPRAVWFGSDLTSQSGLTTCLGLQCRVKQVLYQ